jgi:ribosome recycling factor
MALELIEQLKKKMDSSLDILKKDFQALRTGRASTALLDHVTVDAYGSQMPISQLGTISAPEPRMLSIQIWDHSMIKSVEKALMEANLGLNPLVEGQLIRLPLPDLSEERRRELTKVAAKYSEATKISIRNVRRDGMDTLKDMEKKSEITEDEHHRFSEEVQELTDKYIKIIDELYGQKEKDIMQI